MSGERESRRTSVEEQLRCALSVEPSPDFLPRVRERLSREAAKSSRALHLSWLVPIAATLLVAAALTPLLLRISPPSERRRAEAPPASSTESAPPRQEAVAPAPREAAVPITVGRRTQARHAPAASVPARRAASSLPEVIADSRQQAALRRFVEEIRGLQLRHETVLGIAPSPIPEVEARVDPAWPRAVEQAARPDEIAADPSGVEPVELDD